MRAHGHRRDGRDCRRRSVHGDVDRASDVVFADDDGCLFVSSEDVEELLVTARNIWETERRQAEGIKAGRALRAQLDFARYLEKRTADPSHTFRDHLRNIDGAIEEKEIVLA